MSKKLSELPLGALIKEKKSMYYGKPVVWRVIDKNHKGYPSNSVTLISDRMLCVKPFDAKEANNSDTDRKENGNNRYIHSNMRQWLNSSAASGKWYTAKHSADAPPTSANVWRVNGLSANPYDTEAGFLYGFSANMRAAFLNTTLTVAKNTVTDGGGSETCVDKIFLASNTEVGLKNENNISEGSVFSVFNSDSARLANPTAEAVSNNNFTIDSLNVEESWYWWLRTPITSNSCKSYRVNSYGGLNGHDAYIGRYGVRPLCNLPSEILISDKADSDGVFKIVWNPPTNPASIAVPDTARGGEKLTIEWGLSTVSNSSISGYILERAYNGTSNFTQIYKGSARTFTDTITFGWKDVTYRVKAYNKEDEESGYTTSPTRTVINNTAPSISGQNEDLGLKTGPFNTAYTVTDPDENQEITVVEYIDDKLKRSFTAESGHNYSCNVTAAIWRELQNGPHKLTITAEDNLGGTDKREYTFTKNETEIELTLQTPLPAEEMVEKALLNVIHQVPFGATFKVEVCNNAYDLNPAWEDVTNAVLETRKIFLKNKSKTSSQWGFNFRIMIDRNGTQGECCINAIRGNYI